MGQGVQIYRMTRRGNFEETNLIAPPVHRFYWTVAQRWSLKTIPQSGGGVYFRPVDVAAARASLEEVVEDHHQRVMIDAWLAMLESDDRLWFCLSAH